MTEKEWLEKLRQEGYTNLEVRTIEPGEDPEHTHELQTVNVILTGELTIIDEKGTKTFGPGERVETPAGTSHRAKGGNTPGTMIVGVKKTD
ncbi:MAG: cupin domain-containing protein [Candidatus Woykebacteria bacterium]